MRKEYRYGLIVGCAFLCFLGYGLFVPCRLDVHVSAGEYLDEGIQPDDVSMQYRSLLGIPFSVSHGRYSLDANQITVWAGGFSHTESFSVKVPKSVSGVYHGKAYAGLPLDASKFSISADYGKDGIRPVNTLYLSSHAPFVSDSHTVTIDTVVGQVDVPLDVVQPTSLKAGYNGNLQAGATIQSSGFYLEAVYPDGTKGIIMDVSVDNMPAVVQEGVSVKVNSPYGSADITLHEQEGVLSAHYDGVVYEGESLNPKKIQAIWKRPDGSEQSLQNVKVDTNMKLYGHSVLSVSTGVGSCLLSVNPVKLTQAIPIFQEEPAEQELVSLKEMNLVYADGKTKKIKGGEVSLRLPKDGLVSGKNTVLFTYQNGFYTTDVFVIPREIQDIRSTTLTRSKRLYTMTDDEINKIAILCERVAGQDLQVLAQEATLILNRYELYGSKETTGSAILSYMQSSKFWGDVDGYVKDLHVSDMSKLVVRDVFVNGYRQMPTYVDNRVPSDATLTMSSPKKDVTGVTVGSQMYRYYGGTSDGPKYMYQEQVYQTLMKKDLPEVQYDDVSLSDEKKDENDIEVSSDLSIKNN